MNQRTPRNTTRAMQDDGPAEAMLLLAQAMSDGPGGMVEAQEAAGQREMVNSTVIPTEVHGATDDDLTRLGFTLGPAVDGDPLFRQAQLPNGWKREAGEDPRGSYLLDELGRRRCSIFFKAAFYDRRADMSVTSIRSYVASCVYDGAAPVLDDEWAPRDKVLAALDELSSGAEAAAAEFQGLGMAAAAERRRAEAGKCAALRAQLETAPRG